MTPFKSKEHLLMVSARFREITEKEILPCISCASTVDSLCICSQVEFLTRENMIRFTVLCRCGQREARHYLIDKK